LRALELSLSTDDTPKEAIEPHRSILTCVDCHCKNIRLAKPDRGEIGTAMRMEEDPKGKGDVGVYEVRIET
jgi:hypothetical protein